jgi:hypothetical protein
VVPLHRVGAIDWWRVLWVGDSSEGELA